MTTNPAVEIDLDKQRVEFEAAVRELDVNESDLARDSFGEYINSQIDYNWSGWKMAARAQARASQAVAAEGQQEPVACPSCNGTGGHWEGCPAPIDSGVDDGLGLAVCVIRRPGMVPCIKNPYGDMAAYIRELYKHNPDADVTLVRVWADEVGCQSAEDGREYLEMQDSSEECHEFAAPVAQQSAAGALTDERIAELFDESGKSAGMVGRYIRFARAVLAEAGRESAAPDAKQDAKDAARYRWLRDESYIDAKPRAPFIGYGSNGTYGECGHIQLEGESADSAIDAAMQKGAQ